MGKWYSTFGRRMTEAEKSSLYRERYPDRVKAAQARRKITHSYNNYVKDKIRESPISYLFTAAKRRSKRKGITFSIEKSDIVIPEVCPILGLPLVVLNEGRPGPNSMTLDRRDNAEGYVPGNVFVISYRANVLKNDATITEVEAILRYMKE